MLSDSKIAKALHPNVAILPDGVRECRATKTYRSYLTPKSNVNEYWRLKTAGTLRCINRLDELLRGVPPTFIPPTEDCSCHRGASNSSRTEQLSCHQRPAPLPKHNNQPIRHRSFFAGWCFKAH